MAKPTIVTRAGKGSALTWAEGDANSTNLQTAAVPDGGAAGDYLVKNSATNWDFGWTDRVNAKTIFENVKNVSGGSLAKGTPVTQVGVTGNTITVEAARADDPDLLAIGVLDQTLADEAEGLMIVLGEIKGVNTNAFDTGDKIYLGATGGYTNVKPTALDVAVQFLGIVNRISSTVGSGFITGTLIEDAVRYTGTDFEFWTGTDWEELPYLSAVEDDAAPALGGDLDVGAFAIVSSTNGIILEPAAAQTIDLVADTVIVGPLDTNTTITTDGTSDLILSTNDGLNSGNITIADGVNGNITVTTNGSGRLIATGIIQAPIISVATSTSTETIVAVSQGHNTADANNFTFNRARGSLTSPTAVTVGDELCEINVRGHDGTNNVDAFVITTTVDDTVSTGVIPTLTEFKVQTDGTLETYIAFDAVNAKTVVNGINYYENEPFEITYASTITPDVANGNIQTVTLTGGVTFSAFANPIAGQSLTLFIVQDGTGGRALTSTMLFAGGDKTLTTAGDSVDIMTVFYDGTDYWASLGKDYK